MANKNMSYLYASANKQIAVANLPGSLEPPGLFITGGVELLNHSNVTSMSSAVLNGNITDAINSSLYTLNHGKMIQRNGFLMEGIPYIHMNPKVNNARMQSSGPIRDGGIGIGLGTTLSNGVILHNPPGATIDVFASDADIRLRGSSGLGGRSRVILQSSVSAPGIIQGYSLESLSNVITESRVSAGQLINVQSVKNRFSIGPYRNSMDTTEQFFFMDQSGNVRIGSSVGNVDLDNSNFRLHVLGSFRDSFLANVYNETGNGLRVRSGSDRIALEVLSESSNGGENINCMIVNSSGISVRDSTPISAAENIAMRINGDVQIIGSLRAYNTVFAFCTISFDGNIPILHDHQNISSVTFNGSAQSWEFRFERAITPPHPDNEFTIIGNETSGQRITFSVSDKTDRGFKVIFRNSEGGITNFAKFSFLVFVNPDSERLTGNPVSVSTSFN